MVVLNYLLTQISFLTIKTNVFSTYVVLIQSLAAIISYKKLSCRWQTARRMCKCNDVADLTRVIKIRRKKNWFLKSGLSRSLNVIGTHTNRLVISDFLLVFSSNFVRKTHGFRDIRAKNAVTYKSGLGVRQSHWTCHHSIERVWLPINVL